MIVVMSLWRTDAARSLEARVSHLLAKTASGHDVRWLWAVGDSADDTEARLVASAAGRPVTVVRCDSGIGGEDAASSRRRLAVAGTRLFAALRDSDDIACLHESDLVTPPDLLDRLLAGKTPAAGWPTITLNGHPQFYDTWAYRTIAGDHFRPDMRPPSGPFEVGSFGSCWAAPARLVRGRQLDEECVVGLCGQWRREGVRLWVDPAIPVVQPASLWVMR